MQALIQTDTSFQYSWQKVEKTYTEACLGRLNVSERPSVNQSRSTQSTIVGTTKSFIAQYERLKIEEKEVRLLRVIMHGYCAHLDSSLFISTGQCVL